MDLNHPDMKHQYISAIIANIGPFIIGNMLGFTSPSSASLTNGESSILLTEDQMSWFSSSLFIGAMIGGAAAGKFMSFFGRRGTMMALITPLLAGWLTIATAQHFAMLLVGRIVLGLSMGVLSVTVPSYVGEISSPTIRGKLGALFSVSLSSGIVYVFLVGIFVTNFRYIAGFCLLPVMLFQMAFLAPESPSYLVMMNREEEARNALKKLNGVHFDISSSIESLHRMSDKSEKGEVSSNLFRKLLRPQVYKPLLIASTLMMFQQISGVNSILFYLEPIFKSSGSAISPKVGSILVPCGDVVGSFVSAYLMDSAGRKVLLMVSSFGMSISLVFVGLFFYLNSIMEEWVSANLFWLPLPSLICFIFSFDLGVATVPFVVVGEIFTPDIIEVCVSITSVVLWMFGFIITLTFTSLKEILSDYGVFWLYSGFCISLFFFTFFCVTETKGQTIEQISKIYSKKSQHNQKETKNPA